MVEGVVVDVVVDEDVEADVVVDDVEADDVEVDDVVDVGVVSAKVVVVAGGVFGWVEVVAVTVVLKNWQEHRPSLCGGPGRKTLQLPKGPLNAWKMFIFTKIVNL